MGAPVHLTRRQLVLASLAAAASALVVPIGSAEAADAPQEYEAVGGYFFGQTGGGKPGVGFGISDADGIAIWSTFKSLGAVEILGYPISRRFDWRGRRTQVFQRAVLQYEPLEKRVIAMNVMDLLHDAGADAWLAKVGGIPAPLAPAFDKGKDWQGIVEARQALLDAEPVLRDAYFGVPDPIGLYGLPTSPVQDNDTHLAVRLQRGVLQLWKEDTDWAAAGTVTAALSGELARDAGLFKALGATQGDAFAPEVAWAPKPAPPAPPKPVAPPISRPAWIGPTQRWVDVNLSRQWAIAAEGDQVVHAAPCTTGKAGFQTPTGTFQIFSRVFNETMDSATIGIPRGSAEGYYLKDIFFTQYFADGGIALHTNYWQPANVFGSYPTSHGCVGLRYADAQFLWTFATFGTPVYIHY